MPKRMGIEGQLLYGAAGSTAATPLACRDLSLTITPTEADVSDRSTPVELTDVALYGVELSFEVNNNDQNPFIGAVRTAAVTRGAIAFRTRDRAAGWGIDADFIVRLEESQALKDAQRIRIVAKPTDKAGRIPTFG